MRDETGSLLPWYVNRTLDETERTALARRIRIEPGVRNEWLFWEELATAQSRTAAVAEDIALQRTLERIRHESVGAKAAHRNTDSFVGWMRGLVSRPDAWLRPALACALVVVAVQATVLFRHHDDESGRMRGATPASVAPSLSPRAANTVLLRVAFDPAATEGEVRLLIAEQGAWIVGGPGNGGEYYLAVPNQRVIAATDALRAAAAVREVAGVESVPQKHVQ